ncbi:M61 family metallopeptidase [Sphingomonas bacterium]|uniref:M61 family metallopeptidase n=1 Tax=Sphingomonas bacterium TaxID=1895847 RepID=UPI001576745A|nr:M61 family metallopeptidase [Sphingomonas bacterium]
MLRSGLAVLLLCAGTAALAQVPSGNSAPQPYPYPAPIAPPQDRPFPGTIALDIDATNPSQGIFDVKETIPVTASGDTVFFYPHWIPGNHAPSGQIEKLTGLTFRAGNTVLPWRRDPVNLFAFHIDVPAGTRKVEAAFQFVGAVKPDEGAVFTSPDLLRLQWISASLYPAGYFVRDIPVAATVKYPDGFTAVSAVPSTHTGQTYRYQLSNYEVLMDSPVLAGRYYKAYALTPRVTLDTFADKPEELVAKPEQIAAHTRLVEQAVKLFGAQHYDNYHFLLSISDQTSGSGLEHHRSSEDGTRPGYFTEWDSQIAARNLLPHEYTHSWDGKFRRAADLWVPAYDQPMRPGLLWVYEGQTQFWGYVLQARSGLVSKEDTLDQLAGIAAQLDTQPGRRWRALFDTTYDESLNARRPKGWASWQRGEEYYNEGLLIWLDADEVIRERSGGAKSIDDFARAFYGMRDGDYGELTYTVDDVVRTLNGVVPYDWAGFLDKRVNQTSSGAPLDGFTKGGYKLVYTDQPTKVSQQGARTRGADFTYSIGMGADSTGNVTGVLWDGPAFKAGLVVGAQLLAVGDGAYSPERLNAAITAAKGSNQPIRLVVKHNDQVKAVTIDYHGGLRYPHLVKTGTADGGLDRLLASK